MRIITVVTQIEVDEGTTGEAGADKLGTILEGLCEIAAHQVRLSYNGVLVATAFRAGVAAPQGGETP